jgi:hypothetical protein
MGIIKKITSTYGRGKTMYDALQKEMQGDTGKRVNELLEAPPYLLELLPASEANEIARYVMRESQKGRRAESIAKDLEEKLPDHVKGKAVLIAQTQVSIAETALERVRAEKEGLYWYVWRACGGRKGDGKTRDSHRKMSGIVVNWNDPPAPEKLFPSSKTTDYGHYHAGCCPLCRCYAEVVVDEDELKYPVKVHIGGQIYKMTKKEFRQIINNSLANKNIIARKGLLSVLAGQLVKFVSSSIQKKFWGE